MRVFSVCISAAVDFESGGAGGRTWATKGTTHVRQVPALGSIMADVFCANRAPADQPAKSVTNKNVFMNRTSRWVDTGCEQLIPGRVGRSQKFTTFLQMRYLSCSRKSMIRCRSTLSPR